MVKEMKSQIKTIAYKALS